jgi:hypothetical protein
VLEALKICCSDHRYSAANTRFETEKSRLSFAAIARAHAFAKFAKLMSEILV